MRKSIQIMILVIVLIILSTLPTYGMVTNVQNMDSENRRIFFIKDDNSLWYSGCNIARRPGITKEELHYEPIKIMDNVKGVSLGSFHNMVIKEDDSLWIWGLCGDGRLGYLTKEGHEFDTEEPIYIMDDVAYVGAGENHSLAVKKDGSLWTWGNNSGGQLGDGSTENRKLPTYIMDNVVIAKASAHTSMAIKEDGSLWAWGSNMHGNFGNGTEDNSLEPIKVMDDVIDISLTDTTTMILKKDGGLYTNGNTVYGSREYLGDDSEKGRSIPKKIMDDVIAIDSKIGVYLALKKDGSLWAWGGWNIGSSDGQKSHIPTKILDDVNSMAAGADVSMAVKNDGSLWVWGQDHDGALGFGQEELSIKFPKKLTDGMLLNVVEIAEEVEEVEEVLEPTENVVDEDIEIETSNIISESQDTAYGQNKLLYIVIGLLVVIIMILGVALRKKSNSNS